jgi:hypothetical protein
MRSREFREEFLQLVRNDEIHIRLFSLHLYLLLERLKTLTNPNLSLIKSPSEYLSFKRSLMILQTRKFPRDFMYHAYASFHSHLPEELFFEDFCTFFKKANQQTYKALATAFDKCDN